MTDHTIVNGQDQRPRKKRRVFLWVFLAVQAAFIAWIAAGAASASGTPADCGQLSAETCNAAANAGAAIGVMLIVVVWCVVDFLLGFGYLVYRVAKR